MKRVQTKLAVLGAVAAVALGWLGGILIRGSYVEYVGLANFKQTTLVSGAAYDLARSLTNERQLAYQASAFLGEGTPQEMEERYRAAIVVTRGNMERLRHLAGANQQLYSDRFRASLEEAIASEAPLNQIRDEILDPQRDTKKEAAVALKTKALRVYDVGLFAQANFLPVLAVETEDAELVRKIVTQDTLARLQKDFWKVKGLIGTVFRDNHLAELAAGELKNKRLAVDDHVSRLLNLSDPAVVAATQRLIESEDYVFITNASNKILELGTGNVDFKSLADSKAYQTGPFRRVEAQFEVLGRTVAGSIRSYTDERLGTARRRLILLVTCSVLTLFGLAAFSYYIARGITRPLRGLSDRLADTAGRGIQSSRAIANSSQRLSEDACHESAALQQISASVGDLAEKTATNLEHVRNLSHLATKASGATEEGRRNIATLNEAMAAIQKTSNDIAAILRNIDEIAFQTNILALNAAIEAARAGEAGAGFAVVAEEVRGLAQRSAQAAQETRTKIELALQSNAQGAAIGRQVQQRFSEIAALTRESAAMVAEIEAASTQSNQGIDQVRAGVGRLDGITQRTAAAAEENARASVEMSAEMENIFRYIGTLEAMVSRTGHQPPGSSAPAVNPARPGSASAPDPVPETVGI